MTMFFKRGILAAGLLVALAAAPAGAQRAQSIDDPSEGRVFTLGDDCAPGLENEGRVFSSRSGSVVNDALQMINEDDWAERWVGEADSKERRYFDLLIFLYGELGMQEEQFQLVLKMMPVWLFAELHWR